MGENQYIILLADDEPIERMALAKRLKKHFGEHCRICQAENGKEALALFRQKPCQVVIMDIAMPEMNGVEAAEQIRALDSECSIIFLSAYDDFAYARKAIQIRALDYLLKPCEDEDLVAVIEEAIHQAECRAGQEKALAAGEGVQPEAASSMQPEAAGDIQSGSAGSMQPEAAKDMQSGSARDMQSGAAGSMQSEAARGVQSEAGRGKQPVSGKRSRPGDGAAVQAKEQQMESIRIAAREHAAVERMTQAAEKIRDYLQKNYMKEISMQEAARMMEYSDAYFCKLFKQCFGQNFTTYLTILRVNEAKKLLEDPFANIREVSMKVGYYDSNYFAKVFKRYTGMIPSDYRDSQNAQG